MFLISLILVVLMSGVYKNACQFTPPADEVCLGGSITYNCTLTGRFAGEQFFIYRNLTTLRITDLNSMTIMAGVDLSRVSATVDNTQIPNSVFFSFLSSNITLVNITKEDNGTLIGCKSFNIDTSSSITRSDILILSPPPSPPTLHLTPIPSNCTVMLLWDPPSSHLPIMGYRLSYKGGDIILNGNTQYYISDALEAGNEIMFNLTALSCVGDSLPSVAVYTLTKNDFTECSADYDQSNSSLNLHLISEDNFIIFNFTLSTPIQRDLFLTLSGSGEGFGNVSSFVPFVLFPGVTEYSVSFVSRLRGCVASYLSVCSTTVSLYGTIPSLKTVVAPTATQNSTQLPSCIRNTTQSESNSPIDPLFGSFIAIFYASAALLILLFTLVLAALMVACFSKICSIL